MVNNVRLSGYVIEIKLSFSPFSVQLANIARYPLLSVVVRIDILIRTRL